MSNFPLRPRKMEKMAPINLKKAIKIIK